MSGYKSRLREQLSASGWEVVAVEDGVDWWADEHWRAASRWELWGHEIVLSFLVDPMWDAPRKKGRGIWAIIATETIPPARPIGKEGIAYLCMMKGMFDEKLDAFVRSLNDYRDHLGQRRTESD